MSAVTEVITKIKATNDQLHSFREVFEQPEEGNGVGLLQGLPIAIKDNICTKEGHTTAGSQILKNYQAPYEATVISRVKDAGAVIVGKTNLDEFAMGSSGEYSSFEQPRNPWDVTRIPGGSSAGSAVAVAGNQVPLALGTDTGGSIRQPAAMCGVVGVKPTYGRVSRFGAIAYGSSLDQVGPFAKTVKDAARLLQVIAGPDARDATTSPQPVPDYLAACGQDIVGLKIGVPIEFFGDGIDPDIAKVVRQALDDLKEQGAELKEISLPLTSAAVAVYFLIAKAEGSSNLARYDGLRYGTSPVEDADLLQHYLQTRGTLLGPEVKRTLLMGAYALAAGHIDAWYKQASQVRTLIRRQYEQAFQHLDVIAGPTSPEVAWKFGAKADDPLAMYLADALTVPMSVAGLPALSLPCGFSQDLPVGLQLTATHFAEDKLFQLAHAYEQSHDWHQQIPPNASQ